MLLKAKGQVGDSRLVWMYYNADSRLTISAFARNLTAHWAGLAFQKKEVGAAVQLRPAEPPSRVATSWQSKH